MFSISQPSTSTKQRFDPEDYRHVLKSELANSISNTVSFPNRGILCVNETGIYDLVNASRKPEARMFRKWVNGTVLPAMHKDDMYANTHHHVLLPCATTSDTTNHPKV